MYTKSIAAVTLAITVLTGSAQAYTLYIDEATYMTQTGAVSVALPNVGNVGGSFSTGGLTFSSFGAATDLFSGTAGVENIFGADFAPALAGNDLAISGPENFSIDFVSVVTAFSLKFYEPTSAGPATPNSGPVCNAPCFNSAFDVSLFLGGTKVTDSKLTISPIDDAVTFVGLADLSGFDRVVITDLTGTSDNEFFGEFTVAGLSTVPVPAPLGLLAGGLLSFGLFRRRRT